MTPQRPSTFFITGASSGIGRALAHAAAARGDNVLAVSRDVSSLAAWAAEHDGRVRTHAADVRDQAAVEGAVAAAVEAFGRIDVVHNNAGFGVFGAVEEVSDAQARGIFDTNVFGVLNVLRATLPVLRAQRSGHVLQGSSFYGQVSHPGVGLLCATKYAVEGLTDALVGELEPLGIKVTLVEPGATATAFGGSFRVAAPLADYDQTVREVARTTAETPASALDDPDRVAAAILVAVDAEHPPLRLATGTTGLELMRTALEQRLAEQEAWRSTSAAVDGTRTAVA